MFSKKQSKIYDKIF